MERILAAKQRDAGEDVSALEREIGEAVYALYALTPEEIALVEGTMCPKYKVVAVDVERIGAAAETSTAQPETAAVS